MSQTVVEFDPSLDRRTAPAALRHVDEALGRGAENVVFDLQRVEQFDSIGMGALLHGLQQARRRAVHVQIRGMSPEMRELFALVSIERLTGSGREQPARQDLASRVGGRVEPILDALHGVLATGVETLRGLLVEPLRGRRLRLDRLAVEVEAAFFGALPIVVLIGFLLGLILAMQAYVQLRVWGADIYMADMVGVSVVYEIGPLMTGIILAARSGSANAAQLGSMAVAEEIDALRQMGVRARSYLVVPKVLALAFSVVALGVLFDWVAVVGGALFGYAAAGIEPRAYMAQTSEALRVGSFLLAATKSVVFGAVVGVVGCGLGLRVRGGSDGISRATTNTVVLSIFLIIVIDSLFVAGQHLWS
ncbi:MAG: ABC transporter permease [Planctomycetes bacterium]|nr:ABC transporter permease [Planctomycetota bacterium]MCB9871934.1 ABC transporter permease [Planctomycetota bacterium]